MSYGEFLFVGAMLMFGYPLLVLLVAMAGPHSEAEKRELRDKRWRDRPPPA